jgi:transcriptional regulator with XRE-family HTH domain
VISKTAIARERDRRLRHLSMRIGDEVRQLRLDAGVSLRELGDATQIDPSHIARIEKARVRPSLDVLTAVSVALGANMSLRFYADTGPRIHDRHQAPMIETLLRALDPNWIPQLEVVVPGRLRGAADLLLTHRTNRVVVVGEAQSQFRRIEQQLRWIGEKAAAFASEDETRLTSRLLLLRSTESTRAITRAFATTLSAAYPARSIDVFDALTGTTRWPGAGILWVRLEHGVAELLPRPPRGVAVGR